MAGTRWYFVASLLMAVVGLCVFTVVVRATDPLFCESTQQIKEVGVVDGFCPAVWAAGLKGPRGLVVASNGDIIVIEKGVGHITVLWDSDKDGQSSSAERAVLGRQDGLTHGLVLDEEHGFLYASTSRQVFRWRYTAGQRVALPRPTLILEAIPCCGHVSRSLVINGAGDLYVAVGSSSNVDQNDEHARIHYFTYADIQRAQRHGQSLHWLNGTSIARGMRNVVGFTFDGANRLWGVENGVDNVRRTDLMTAELSYNNPAEEVNLFAGNDKFYGYPFCWSEYEIPMPPGKGRTTQWAHPLFMNTGRPEGTDEWCQNPDNVVPPKYGLPAHSAPLDIKFYRGSKFPSSYAGSAFVSLHGSWNRVDPVGYAVVQLHFDAAGKPTGHTPFLYHATHHVDRMSAIKRAGGTELSASSEFDITSTTTQQQQHTQHTQQQQPHTQRHDENDPSGGLVWWMHRPVGLGVGDCGTRSECVFVTSDTSGIIMAVAYD